MTEYLIIRDASATRADAAWTVVEDQGAILEPGGRASLAELAVKANNRRVALLVPALDVLLTSATVPVRGKQKLQQALPFAMEEQLAEDVEALHFAPGGRSGDDLVQVAVTRREKMQAWHDLLDAAGIEANFLYSEAEGLDHIPGTATLLIEGDNITLRSHDGALASGDRDSLPIVLDLWLLRAEQEENDGQPHLLVYQAGTQSPDVVSLLENIEPRLQSLEIRNLTDGALPRLAANLATNPGINLLQGDFARGTNLMRFWPAWRLAAALLAAVLVAALATAAASTWQAGRRAEALQASIEQAFRYSFPNVGQVLDVRSQLESRLRSLGSSRSNNRGAEFLDILQQVAKAMDKIEGAKLEAVDYRAGTLELRVRAPNVEALDRIQRDIVAAGRLEAEIQSANAEDDIVLGRLRISGQGA